MLVTVRVGHQTPDPPAPGDGDGPGRRRLGPPVRRVLQPAVARAPAHARACRSRCSARPTSYRGTLQMTNPIVDLIGDRTGRIVPIYPQSEKAAIHTWELAELVEQALRRCERRGLADPVPGEVRRRLGLVDRQAALFGIHLPDVDGRQGAGPPPAGVRRAAPGAARARAAQARARTGRAGHPPRGRRRAGAPLPRPPALPADRRAAPRHRRDRGRPGRRPIRCTACCRATSAAARPWWP